MFSFIKHITMSPCKKALFHRYLSTTFEHHSRKRTLECLNHRSILRVSGNEVTEFLQGLVTNDMRHLEEGALSMYTMFLNTKGRVLYDAIIYRTNSQNAYYIESDSAAVNSLQKHLKLYRVRRKIDIENVESELKVWALYNAHVADVFINNCDNSSQPNNLTEQILLQIDCTIKELSNRDIIACKDPRLSLLGIRLLYAANKSETDIITELDEEVQLPKDEAQYKILRYKLGVGEGVIEIPTGNCFPLEANCDYLHGVSFHKGCYIGQELTARTHHTGVVRKRLMPLIFDLVPKNGLEHDAPILAASGVPKKPIGKLRGVERNVGIGLLRVSEALDSETLQIYDGTGHTMKPFWWPQEAPKERVSLVKR